jgi:hypothetical protein
VSDYPNERKLRELTRSLDAGEMSSAELEQERAKLVAVDSAGVTDAGETRESAAPVTGVTTPGSPWLNSENVVPPSRKRRIDLSETRRTNIIVGAVVAVLIAVLVGGYYGLRALPRSSELTTASTCKEWNEHTLQQNAVAQGIHNSVGGPSVSVLEQEISQVCATPEWESSKIAQVASQLIAVRP